MKIQKILRMEVDIEDDVVRETSGTIRAILSTLPREQQIELLLAVRADVETLLKGVGAFDQSVHESGRSTADQRDV
ncbi:hypothetical protein CDO73_03575 [Saccharibacillus sp. O23]|uniref:hypothetical protein n=1 Tax=Saccharibacillus sp. O23 TaxID=2009338 RepID=UPI000B4E795E|nr:hypothetical protein [Saccharibacillus sp. O23]OWR32692.1 hypothetical protein CDO73_03575 [Saccharibacillus sp. O23]